MKTKKICLLAMFVAIDIAIGFVQLPLLDNAVRLTFSFLVSMTVASIFGFWDCVIYAIVADVVGFFITNTAGDVFFVGYTISAVLGLIIYWIFLHRKVTLISVAAAKASVNVFVNIVVGSIWRTMLYGKAYMYYLANATIKNVILFPIEIFMFYYLYKMFIEKIKQLGYLNEIQESK